MAINKEQQTASRIWPFVIGAVLFIVLGVFSTQAFSAGITVVASPLQNVGGDLTYSSDWSSASAIVTRHEGSTATINVSDQITGVTVDGTKASGGANAKVDLLDASATILDTITVALPSAAGAYNTIATLTGGTTKYNTVATVLATYTASGGGPAVAVDGSISTRVTDEPPFSWSHTVGAGANRLLVVAISESDAAIHPTGVTFGAAAMTPGPAYASGTTAASLWYLKDPAVSTATITASYSPDPPPDFVGGAINFINVDQTTPVSGGTGAQGQSSSGSVNVTSATDDMVVSVISVFERNVSATGTPTPTVHWDLEGVGSKAFGIGATQAGQTSVTSSFNITGNSEWAVAAMNIKKAP